MKKRPVWFKGHCEMNGNVVACDAVLYTVPAGKRLVIEYASMEASLPVGQMVRMMIQILADPLGSSFVNHLLPMSSPAPAGLFTGAHQTSIGQVVRLYAEAGNVVRIWAQRNDGTGGSGSATFAISGYETNV